MATTTAPPLKLNQKVHALTDLVGVPRGTKGKVLLIGGISWKRYWVDFENGASLPGIDRSEVGTKDEWLRAKDGPVASTETESAAGAQAVADVPEGEAVDGIPFHLLDRSKRARERLGPPK